MTVDIQLVEVDRRDSCLLDRSCCRSRSSGRDGGGHGGRYRKRVRRSQRQRQEVDVVHDDFDGRELVRPFASIVTEDKHTRAVLDIVGGVAVGGDNVVRDDVTVGVERGHSGRGDASVGMQAECEARVVRGSYKEHTRSILVANRNECLTMSYSCLVDGSGRRMNVRDAQLRTCESWVVLPIVMGSAFGFHVWCCSSEDRLAVVVEKRTLRGIHRFEVVREKGTQPAYVSVTIVVSKRTMMRSCKIGWRGFTVQDR